MYLSDLQKGDREMDDESLMSKRMRCWSSAELRRREQYSQSPAVSEHMKPLSKYDNRPRNVEIDRNNNNKVVTAHSRSSHRERRGRRYGEEDFQEEGTSSVTISEFDSDDDELSQVHIRGQKVVERVAEEADGWWAKFEKVKSAGRDGLKWLGNTSKLKLAVLAAILGLVFGIGYRGGWRNVEFFSQDNFLKCPAETYDQPCLTPSQVQLAKLHVEPLTTQLHVRAGQYECGLRKNPKGVTIRELRGALDMSPEGGDVVRSFLYLILFNPHWNIVWIDKDGQIVSDWLRRPHPQDQLLSTDPAMSLSCQLSLFMTQLIARLKIILAVGMAILIVVGVVTYMRRQWKMKERNKFLMVEKILGVLRRHYETTKRKKDLLPYLAIIHVRDMLISPSERILKQETWVAACKWIAENESRVRVEKQRIAGQDFDVWKWIQEDPPHTEDTTFLVEVSKRKVAFSPTVSTTSSSSQRPDRKKNWYNGTTFDDDAGRSTGRNSRINSPYGSPSPCIRLKNMFEATKHMKDDQSKEIEDSVLDRCIAHGGVVHIYVDRRSPYGCVYLKMDSVESAMKAYKALHGGWYLGKLVTAKYIPLEKYHKWFQAATNANEYIYPSS